MDMTCIRAAALLAACLATGQALAAESGNNTIPVEDFARHAQIMSPRLSPDGAYLSVRMDDPSGDSHALIIYRLSDMTVASKLRMPKYEVPLNMVWVSPTRLVISKGRAYGSLGVPASTGELIASDVDGTHQDYIYGSEGVGRRSGSRSSDKGFGHVAGLPPKANGHFYMSTRPWDNENLSMLYDVDAVDNARHLIAEIHEHGMSFLVDLEGKPKFAYGTDGDFVYRVFLRRGKGWSEQKLGNASATLEPLYFAADSSRLYALWSSDGGPLDLVIQDEDGGNRKVLASDDFASVGGLQWTSYPEQPFAATTFDGIPKPIIFQPQLFAAKLYARLEQLFPGGYVDFINFTEDGSKLLFSVSSDRDPGTYYLLDTKALKVHKLFSPMSWIQPERMAERRPIHFKAGDGMELGGFLTLPPKRGEQGLPLVLMPHGGPHGVSDDWFYDSEAQFLASRGYMVLQVNYRGSSGRGDNFEQAGYLNWGTRIQQDMIDGVKWTIEQKYTDPKRICVYGASFGGYSAMMAPIRAPGLFKCAIGYDGIYDLAMMYKKGDIRYRKSGRSYLQTVIGKDDADLDANSPDKLAGKIKIPVFLIHGKDDKRAPFAQAEAMRNALQNAGNPPKWLAKAGEGHGFYTVQNNVERLEAIQAFLEANIGKDAAMQ